MKTEESTEINVILNNIRKIMNDNNLTQAVIAEYADTTPSQMSKIFKGEVQLSLKHLSNIATSLNLRMIDIITYPDVYVKRVSGENGNTPLEAILQIKLQADKKEQVLKLVFGENNLEILNK